MKSYLFVFLQFYFVGTSFGQLGPVRNATVKPIPTKEQSEALVFWLSPANLNGNDPTELLYVVETCALNTVQCSNSSTLTKERYEITNLNEREKTYAIKIYVFDKNMMAGETKVLDTYTVPKKVNFDLYEPTFKSIEEGESLELKCESYSYANAIIRWYKEENTKRTMINPSSNPRYSTNQKQSLIIVNATRGQNEGFFRCGVKTDFGETLAPNALQVQIKFLDYIFVKKPNNVTFYDIDGKRTIRNTCKPPRGAPAPLPIWINGSSGQQVKNTDPRVEVTVISSQGLTSILSINASAQDAGTWECRVQHELGTRTSKFTVLLYGPPQPVKNIRADTHMLNAFRIEWDTIRDDIMTYDLKITRLKTANETSHTINDALTVRTYLFNGLEKGEGYSVTIRATDIENQVGVWSNPIVITTPVDIVPLIVRHPVGAIVGEGGRWFMNCLAQASPQATYKWFNNGVLIPNGDKDYEINGNRITIKSVKHGRQYNDALYHCEATNSLGTTKSNEAKITVHWIGTDWKIKPLSSIFYQGKFLRISAQPPKGVGAITVTWRKGSNQQLTDNPDFLATLYPFGAEVIQSLDISNMNSQMEGVYYTDASNLGGIRTAKFRLAMAAAPAPVKKLEIIAQSNDRVVIRWEQPISRPNVRELGLIYTYRTDVKYEISYVDVSAGVTKTITTNGKYADTKFITRKHTIDKLISGKKYEFKIRSVDNGNQMSDWSSVLTHSVPVNASPFIKKEKSNNVEGKQNGSATIPCIIINNVSSPKVTWYKDGQRIEIGTNGYSSNMTVTFGLLITDIKTSHDGNYHCVVENDHGSATSDEVRLNVIQLGKEFRFHQKEAFVHNGSLAYRHAHILCIPPVSYPKPIVSWANASDSWLNMKNPRFIGDNNYKQNGTTYYSLVILNAYEFIGQKIGCAVYNKPVSETNEIALTTIKLLQVPMKVEGIAIIDTKKRDLLLQLPASAHQQRISSYIVELFDMLANRKQTREINVQSSTTTYQIDNLIPGVKYVIRVRANNVAGLGPWSVTVETNTPLDIGSLESKDDSIRFKLFQILARPSEKPVKIDYQVEIKHLSTNKTTYQTFRYKYNTSETVLVSDLKPSSSYEIRLRTMGKDGPGEWSAPFTAETKGFIEKKDESNGLGTATLVGIVIAVIVIFFIGTIVVYMVIKARQKKNINAHNNKVYEMNRK